MRRDFFVQLIAGVDTEFADEAALGANHILDYRKRKVALLDGSEFLSHFPMTTIVQLGAQCCSFTCLGHCSFAPRFPSV